MPTRPVRQLVKNQRILTATATMSVVDAAAAGDLMAQRRMEDERYAYFAEAAIIFLDLPDAVGHPAFPTTLEGLVSSSRGTVMDAARTALASAAAEGPSATPTTSRSMVRWSTPVAFSHPRVQP